MFRITLTTIVIFMCFSSFAAKYDKAKIAQYLEEQSFNLVIEMGAVISADECDNYLYNAMGYSYYQLGLHTQSDAYYQLSIKLDSNNLQANLHLGILNKQKRNYQNALYYFKRINLLKPLQPKYLKFIADCYASLSQKDSSYSYLGKAYAAAPNDINIKLALAELLYEMKNYTEVDKLVQEGLVLDSNNVSLLGLGVRSGYNQKQYKRILPIVDQMTKMGLGESIFTPIMFGVFAAIQLKDYTKSLSYTDYLMRNGSEAEQVYYYAAKACAGLKQYEKR